MLDPSAGSDLQNELVRQVVLDHIASGEATGYNELYGGKTFSSYAKHPGIEMTGPEGKPTSAAGRYQFEKGTWAQEANRLGLKDFSPTSQDAAAWDLAQRTYKQATGTDLTTAVQQGKVNWGALAGQWPSLRQKVPTQEVATTPQPQAAQPPVDTQATESPQNLEKELADAKAAGPAAAAPTQHDNWKNMLLLGALAGVKFTPVDYNPYAVMPKG